MLKTDLIHQYCYHIEKELMPSLRNLLMFIITLSDHMLIINIKRLKRLVMGLNNPVTKFR